MRLEFTCTAMKRPEIFRQTLESFADNLHGVEYGRLFLNIDPLPADGITDDVVSVARELFEEVIVNVPAEPCFPAAVKWCWSQPGGEFLFHLEDDWDLHQPVDAGEMLSLLQADPTLSLVNLRAYGHNDDRLCLAPGLWRTSHARAIAGRMRVDANPEMQLRPARASNPHGGLHVGYIGRQFPAKRVIKDLGRDWLRRAGLKRDKQLGGQRHFIKWV